MKYNDSYEIEYDKVFNKILDTFFAFQKAHPKYVKELKIIPMSKKFKSIIFQFRMIIEARIDEINSTEFEQLLEFFILLRLMTVCHY